MSAFLTAGAEMGAALADNDALNGCAAGGTGFTCAAENIELFGVASAFASDTVKIRAAAAEGGAAISDAFF